MVCSLPSLSVIINVTVLPTGASVVPVIVGVVSFVRAGASTVMTGGVVSKIAESLPSGVVLPLESTTTATTSISSPSPGAGKLRFTLPVSISSCVNTISMPLTISVSPA